MTGLLPAISPDDVLAFWRNAGPARWFVKDSTFDEELRNRFTSLWEAARDGALAPWQDSDHGVLALIIVLDQFPRNIFRDDLRAFATDAMARAVTHKAVASGRDQHTDPDLRAFVYMPLMHSEDMADQQLSLQLFKALGNADNLQFAELHADIIRRFGRFPHRNRVLRRTTTPEEQAFLDSGGFSG